ncbi:hypothetical protein BpHYR1_041624, partial [Brachionus plicatilis]
VLVQFGLKYEPLFVFKTFFLSDQKEFFLICPKIIQKQNYLHIDSNKSVTLSKKLIDKIFDKI